MSFERLEVPAALHTWADLPTTAGRRLAQGLGASPRIVVCDGVLGRFAVPAGSSGWTIGRTVLVRRAALSADDRRGDVLLAHECIHVAQYAERGAVRFLARYAVSYLGLRLQGFGHWDAYRRIPAEAEAYTIGAALAAAP